MTLEELRARFDGIAQEAFRLEQEQSYAGVSDPGWVAWKAGQPLPVRTVENDDFLKQIGDHVGAGRRVYRVVVVDRPIGEYLRYELTAFGMHVAVGEEVYVVWRDAHPDLTKLVKDFWMLDEDLVAVMRYNEGKRFIEAVQPAEPVETYIARRNLAMKYAVPLEQWMAKHGSLSI